MRTFVVFGGGEVGSVSARQLRRAMDASRLDPGRILIVDKNPSCLAAGAPGVEMRQADWSEWLYSSLDSLAPDDHLVPYHFAPHLFLTWLVDVVRARGGAVERLEVPPRGLPWEAATRGGDRALSYATWTCPALCIEPEFCPETRGVRFWDLGEDLAESLDGDEPIVFPCLHLAYGVATLPVSRLFEARDRMVAGLAQPRNYLVGTSSRCHALAARIRVFGA